MNYKELYLETKEMLEEFDFIDRRLHSFKNMNDLKWFVDMIDVFSG